ncbi:hypothetical protein AB1Y20_015339 [Prymnesium parvum]|uniref:Magnesium-dependent phosphatase 1 n=1 Tax=Prymnesium parvum TaxID=97485 RepID=A0AB34JXI2_PRYPA
MARAAEDEDAVVGRREGRGAVVRRCVPRRGSISAAMAAGLALMAGLPKLLVFDLDACLWTPEMYELHSSPSAYDESRGGVAAGHDTVRLFPGAAEVLQLLLNDPRYATVQVAVASSTTEPKWAHHCLDVLLVDPERGETIADIVAHRQIYPGSKGSQHFPRLREATGVEYAQMVFWDDCSYSDNCEDVARKCPGALCVRTPEGLTRELFEAGLAAFARGEKGVLST